MWACVCPALPRGGYFLVCVVRTMVRQCGNSWRQRQYASSYRVMCTSQTDVLFCGSAWGKPEECGDVNVERAAIPGVVGESETPMPLGSSIKTTSIGHSSHFLTWKTKESLVGQGGKRAGVLRTLLE